MRVIYDFGANNGDDITYYLKKAEKVVAVEADPKLASSIQERFRREIDIGRLVVENYVVTTSFTKEVVPFYIHQGHHVLSQLARPSENEMDNFVMTSLPTKSVTDIINSHGSPHYIKIDLEGLDAAILAELFRNDIYPPYLSAEAHSAEVFEVLSGCHVYESFKLIDGESVGSLYVAHDIITEAGYVHHHFPVHSAGPFGNDILGPWESVRTFTATLAQAGFGWKDIHVSRVDPPER